MSTFRGERIFTLNDPTTLRVVPALASEIGLNESIILLQLEYLLTVFGHERDGRRWVYWSCRELRRRWFPFWSPATIHRTIQSLEAQGLIDTTTQYNRHRYDKTQWMSLNMANIGRLHSVAVKTPAATNTPSHFETPLFQNETRTSQDETSLSQNETPLFQNETRTSQDETTIPKTLPETLSETTTEIIPEREAQGNAQGEAVPSLSLVAVGECRRAAECETEGPGPGTEHPAVMYLAEVSGRPVHAVAVAAIVQQVPRHGPGLAEWREIVNDWLLHEYRPGNVSGMLDWYLHPEKRWAQSHEEPTREEERSARRRRIQESADRHRDLIRT